LAELKTGVKNVHYKEEGVKKVKSMSMYQLIDEPEKGKSSMDQLEEF
jgi:hypothetical protein